MSFIIKYKVPINIFNYKKYKIYCKSISNMILSKYRVGNGTGNVTNQYRFGWLGSEQAL
jgi:hypothetical protein